MKIRLTALIIILCILCTGCAREIDSYEEYWNNAGKFWDEVHHDYQVIYDADTIRAFAAESDYALPGFVVPDCLGSFGEYDDHFVINGYCNKYSYRFVDANEVKYSLLIYHGLEGALISEYRDGMDDPHLDISDTNGSLMYVNNTEYSTIALNGVLYQYYDGKLSDIIWHFGDVYFKIDFYTINFYPTYRPYPLDGHRTFITKITSLSEYERTTAIKEFLTDYRLYS